LIKLGEKNSVVITPNSQIIIEEPPVGADRTVEWCWATSYNYGRLYTEINIDSISDDFLANPSVGLELSFLFASRFDQASNFRFGLLYDDLPIENFPMRSHSNPSGRHWHKLIQIFPLKAGIRKIKFIWEGKDQSWWAGNYGAKIAEISLKFVFPKNLVQEGIFVV
jgi:hypothetical protein